jgi:sodium transport system permease protein
MRPFAIVARKEIVDGLRDRRAVMSLLVFPLVGPVLVSVMLSTLVERATSERVVTLPISGKDRAPGLVAHLEEQGIRVVDGPPSPLDAVRDGASDAVLVIDEDYPEAVRAGRRAKVQLVVDESREGGRPVLLRVRRALAGYGRTIGALRLLARGVSPELADGIVTEEVDLATPEARGAVFLNFVPMFALLAAFVGGMHFASDLTAGERERGSLEPLLFAPVSRRSIVLGKWLAAMAFAGATVVLTLGCTALAMARIPLERFGMAARLSLHEVGWMLVVVLPLAAFISAVQLLLASFARTVKEAQVSLSLLTFAPMLPALFLSFEPLGPTPLVSLLPVVGQQSLLAALMRGEVATPLAFLGSVASCLFLAALALLATIRLFGSERVVYGR